MNFSKAHCRLLNYRTRGAPAIRNTLAYPHQQTSDGVLQDVHWYAGPVGGAFQGYTLGNILSGQFMAAARNAVPSLHSQWEEGNFEPLHTWLQENIYQYGRKYTTLELVERITGGPIQLGPYQEYLTTKYSDIYGL